MLRSLSRACRRLAIVLAVLGALSSLVAAAHVHSADGTSPSSCSICVQAAHKADTAATSIDFVLSRVEALLPLLVVASLTTATLFRARGRAPPLASLASY